VKSLEDICVAFEDIGVAGSDRRACVASLTAVEQDLLAAVQKHILGFAVAGFADEDKVSASRLHPADFD